MKVLFILKTNDSSGGTELLSSKSGLGNSARFIVDAINEFEDIEASITTVRDQNGIIKAVTDKSPDLVILEAVFVTPSKLRAIVDHLPHVRFVTRLHSRIPFLAMEGNVVGWVKEYRDIAEVAFNHPQTAEDMRKIGIANIYLPNIYPEVVYKGCNVFKKKHHYKIGCFGSIRPFKNQLAQAWGAMIFANKKNAVLHFYINVTNIEQNGEQVLKNIRSLFLGTKHKLVEVDWLERDAFVKLVSEMDACMQVSFTETFNIVAADAILSHVPVVVSNQIDWLSGRKADPNNETDIAEALEYAIEHSKEIVQDNIHDLMGYNHKAVLKWFRFLNREE